MYTFGLLSSGNKEDVLDWINALNLFSNKIKYDVIDLSSSEWEKECLKKNYDCYLLRPPGDTSYNKQMYDERLYILNKVLGKPIYPSFDESLIYENKRILSYYLSARNIPHAKTYVFYKKTEALEFVKNAKFPFVAKTSIGASGSGVKIIESKRQALLYIKQAFSNKGVVRRWKPNKTKKNYKLRVTNRLKDIKGTILHFSNKRKKAIIDAQKMFVIFQEYVKINNEWRCVVIGNNYFGHIKEKRGKLISGGGGVVWDYPSEKLLNFLRKIMLDNGFKATSMDIFELENGEFLVSEIQPFFGFVHPEVQMFVNERPGKYIYENNKWQFVEGKFNENNSYNIRVEHLLSLLKENN